MALTVKMMSSGEVMLTYLHLTTAAATIVGPGAHPLDQERAP